MPVNNVSASSESLSRGPPPALLVPKTYDLWQSDVTATFWHGLWQLCSNNNNKCAPVLPLLRFCCTGHRRLRLVNVTFHPDVSSFRQRRLPAPRPQLCSDRRDCGVLTRFFSVPLTHTHSVSLPTLTHPLLTLSHSLALSPSRFLFTLSLCIVSSIDHKRVLRPSTFWFLILLLLFSFMSILASSSSKFLLAA